MFTYKQALTLAETWVRIRFGDAVQIVHDKVMKKPYGWIFFYQTSKFLESGDHRDALVGNAPIIIDRINFEIKTIAWPLEKGLAEYEATIPKARLLMSLPSEP